MFFFSYNTTNDLLVLNVHRPKVEVETRAVHFVGEDCGNPEYCLPETPLFLDKNMRCRFSFS